jgi:hypothetical protein
MPIATSFETGHVTIGLSPFFTISLATYESMTVEVRYMLCIWRSANRQVSALRQLSLGGLVGRTPANICRTKHPDFVTARSRLSTAYSFHLL